MFEQCRLALQRASPKLFTTSGKSWLAQRNIVDRYDLFDLVLGDWKARDVLGNHMNRCFSFACIFHSKAISTRHYNTIHVYCYIHAHYVYLYIF